MASSRTKSSSTARPARSSSSKATPRKAQVEVVEESGNGGLDAGIAIITTILLIAGFFLLDYELGTHYGEGAFFGSSYSSTQG